MTRSLILGLELGSAIFQVLRDHVVEHRAAGIPRYVGGHAVYLHPADKSSMHPYVCTPPHEMGHLHTLFPIARSQGRHQPEDVWYWKRNKKVAIKHGCEGARELIVA